MKRVLMVTWFVMCCLFLNFVIFAQNDGVTYRDMTKDELLSADIIRVRNEKEIFELIEKIRSEIRKYEKINSIQCDNKRKSLRPNYKDYRTVPYGYEGEYKGKKSQQYFGKQLKAYDIRLNATYYYQKWDYEYVGPVEQMYKFTDCYSDITYGGLTFGVHVEDTSTYQHVYTDGSAIDVVGKGVINVSVAAGGIGKVASIPFRIEMVITQFDVSNQY